MKLGVVTESWLKHDARLFVCGAATCLYFLLIRGAGCVLASLDSEGVVLCEKPSLLVGTFPCSVEVTVAVDVTDSIARAMLIDINMAHQSNVKD